MNIEEIIKKIDANGKNLGFQLSKRNGIINTTWLLYKRNNNYFVFDINQKVEFVDAFKYTHNELIKEFESSFFEIELTIN